MASVTRINVEATVNAPIAQVARPGIPRPILSNGIALTQVDIAPVVKMT